VGSAGQNILSFPFGAVYLLIGPAEYYTDDSDRYKRVFAGFLPAGQRHLKMKIMDAIGDIQLPAVPVKIRTG